MISMNSEQGPGLRRECAFQHFYLVGKVLADKARVPQHHNRAGNSVAAEDRERGVRRVDKKLSAP